MNLLNENLKQRLKFLEEEQIRQNWILEHEINHLETELTARETDNQQSAKIRSLKKVSLPLPTKTKISASSSSRVAAVITLLAEAEATKSPVASTRPVTAVKNYVIRLALPLQPPLEWTGKGWAKCDSGYRYSTLEQTQNSLRQLEKHWPASHLKIMEK